MEKSEILRELQKFIDSKKESATDKKTTNLLSILSKIDSDAISFGEEPSYFFANMECNSTAVGESRFNGTETRRTVALDYITDEYLFIDGHVPTGEKGLSLFYLKPNQRINYYRKADIVKVAKEYGFQLHLQNFRDLNFTLYDHRLNRYKVNVTDGPIKYPIRPIFAKISEKDDVIAIGYVYEKNGKEHIIIEPEDPNVVLKGESGCAPWMLLGLVFPPIWIVALFVWLVKAKKERMRG